jgi:hypothetical protein
LVVVLFVSDVSQTLDISYNAWRPLSLAIPAKMQILRAMGAGVVALRRPERPEPKLQLQKLYIADAPFGIVSDTGDLQLVQWTALLNAAAQLSVLQCINCSLSMDLTSFLPLISQSGPRPLFQELQLSNNGFTGTVPSTLFASNRNDFSLRRSTQIVDLSNNPSLGGQMPMATSGFDALTTINLSNTSISGGLPTTWGLFHALQQVGLQNTSLRCPFTRDADGQIVCGLPEWINVAGYSYEVLAIGSDNVVVPGLHCPIFSIAQQERSSLDLDDAYHQRTPCKCAAPYFGVAGACQPCPTACRCDGAVIKQCYPIVQPGTYRSDAFGNIDELVSLPVIGTSFLPCSRLPSGVSLCNPQGLPWPLFFQEAGVLELSDLSTWCAEGHTARLCSKCSDGYFSSGLLCKRCLSVPLHVFILLANIAMLLAVVIYLYRQQPHAESELRLGLAEYLSVSHAPGQQRSNDSELYHVSSALPSLEAAALELSPAASAVPPADGVAAAAASSTTSSPLKLLLFHSQQASLMLFSASTLPASLRGMLFASGAASNSLSLSSLVALECLSSWTLATRCWLAVAAPLLLAALAACTHLLARCCFPPQRRAWTTRVYGVCISCLYFVLFPSAQVALTALACTDRSEAATALGAEVYLNLQPWTACDARWRREVLPPALLAALFWLLAFPLASTLALRRVHRAVVDVRTSSALMGGGSAPAATASASAASLHAWSLGSSLLAAYREECWYWEQVLLLRRLLLVITLAVLPARSLYVPLLLLTVIQLAALLQHRFKPYRSPPLNAAELASLYLLLLIYSTALLSEAGADSGSDASALPLPWVATLFLLNGAFLLALLVGLVAVIRHRAEGLWAKARAAVPTCWGKPAALASVGEEAKQSDSENSRNNLQELHEPLL